MAKINCGEVMDMLREIESKITLGDKSNQMTMYYFAYIAYYHYCGGKISTEKIINDSTILCGLPTEKAKVSYIANAKRYNDAGLIYFKLINTNKKVHYERYNEIFNRIEKLFNVKIQRNGKYINVVGEKDSIYTELLLYTDSSLFSIWFTNIIGKCKIQNYKEVESRYLQLLFGLWL